jgi:hypothetical protein
LFEPLLAETKNSNNPISGVNKMEPKKYPQKPITLFLPNMPINKLARKYGIAINGEEKTTFK